MKDPLGVSRSMGIREPHEVEKKILLTSVGIEPTTSGLAAAWATRSDREIRAQHSYVLLLSLRRDSPPKSSPTFSVRPRSAHRWIFFNFSTLSQFFIVKLFNKSLLLDFGLLSFTILFFRPPVGMAISLWVFQMFLELSSFVTETFQTSPLPLITSMTCFLFSC